MGNAGDSIETKNANWSFSGEVVDNFEEHVRKSVPLYDEGHHLVTELSDYFIKDDSICYEIGSSAGTLSHKLATKNSFKNAKFYGIEIEEDMVKKAQTLYKSDNLTFVCDDISSYDFKQADMFVSYYTIQFIHPKLRQDIIDTIYAKLHWGGAFVLYEKVRANDARFQDIITGLYQDYKLDQGYSSEEIIAKSRSLKGVLEPFSTQGNKDMLRRAGFKDIITIQKYMNFEGILAIK